MGKQFKAVTLFVAVSALILLRGELASAGIISVAVDGPGGAGASIFTPGDTVVDVAKIFSSVAPIDLTITVSAGGVYSIFESRSQIPGVLNNTGETWTHFEYTLLSAPTGSSFLSARENPLFPPPRFQPPMVTPGSILFDGGTVPSGNPIMNPSGFRPELTLQVSGPGTFVIRQTPSVVPEPNSLVLLAAGAAGFLIYQRGRDVSRSRTA
ncbi:MAG: hypothetical protein C0501_09550 [Isosphaera sp.]|nr:hypothetical protein [Isosphaera sp.]